MDKEILDILKKDFTVEEQLDMFAIDEEVRCAMKPPNINCPFYDKLSGICILRFYQKYHKQTKPTCALRRSERMKLYKKHTPTIGEFLEVLKIE